MEPSQYKDYVVISKIRKICAIRGEKHETFVVRKRFVFRGSGDPLGSRGT